MGVERLTLPTQSTALSAVLRACDIAQDMTAVRTLSSSRPASTQQLPPRRVTTDKTHPHEAPHNRKERPRLPRPAVLALPSACSLPCWHCYCLHSHDRRHDRRIARAALRPKRKKCPRATLTPDTGVSNGHDRASSHHQESRVASTRGGMRCWAAGAVRWCCCWHCCCCCCCWRSRARELVRGLPQ